VKKHMTTTRFIELASDLHPGRYTYANVVYVSSKQHVNITCPTHGDFSQTPNSHLTGSGCSGCRSQSMSGTLEEFLEKAAKVHGARYGYASVVYTASKCSIQIQCSKHGQFHQAASEHLKGRGCYACKREHPVPPSSLEVKKLQFISMAQAVHGLAFDYNKVTYVDAKTKVTIVCPIHGAFRLSPTVHIKGRKRACQTCAVQRRASAKRRTTEEFVIAAAEVHGSRYTYAETVYTRSGAAVKIRCPTHGLFTQIAQSHLHGYGCNQCGTDCTANKKRRSVEDFVRRATKKHFGWYTYADAVYVDGLTKLTITCPLHGGFQQMPRDHLTGRGCSSCLESRGEQAIRLNLIDMGLSFKQQHRMAECRDKNPLPFDFALMSGSHLLGLIEFQGEQHYRTNAGWSNNLTDPDARLKEQRRRDSIKFDHCLREGIPLLTLPYWEVTKVRPHLEAFVAFIHRKSALAA